MNIKVYHLLWNFFKQRIALVLCLGAYLNFIFTIYCPSYNALRLSFLYTLLILGIRRLISSGIKFNNLLIYLIFYCIGLYSVKLSNQITLSYWAWCPINQYLVNLRIQITDSQYVTKGSLKHEAFLILAQPRY